MKNTLLWIGALVVGAVLGVLGLNWLNALMDFIATVYTRLFQLLAVAKSSDVRCYIHY